MKKTAGLLAMFPVALMVVLVSCATAPVSLPTTGPITPAESTASSETMPSPTEAAPSPAEKSAAPSGEMPGAGTRSADKTKESGTGFGAEEYVTEGESAVAPRAAPPATGAPAVSGLQAGFADDNKQFNYFLGFLSTYGGDVPHYPIAVEERIVFRAVDVSGKSIPNAEVTISSGGKVLAQGKSHADGTYLFFPSEHDAGLMRYDAVVTAIQGRTTLSIDRTGKRQIDVRIDGTRPDYKRVPLDILFILDTTGSMGEEIQRLKATIEIININLGSLSSQPKVRFGMVLYRDQGDEYVTRIVPLTEDLAVFSKALSEVTVDGGGDDPEDLQSALQSAMKEIQWNPDGIRLAFVVTDAPPHLDYDQKYTYVNAAHDACVEGVKIYTVGTGGLDLAGEYVLRQISQYTGARYIFLTYGEKGESVGGTPGSVSHHSGSNYQTDKLETVIIRFAKEELAFLTDQPVGDEGDYFEAHRISGEERDATLGKLFDMAISQIIDYSTIRIPAGTPTGALPVVPQADAKAADAEYLSEQLVLSLSRNRTFAMVERTDLQAILKELELQMSGIADEANASRVGALMNAKMLVISKMYDKGATYEIFLKLLGVETGEIMSVTKLVIDKGLGL